MSWACGSFKLHGEVKHAPLKTRDHALDLAELLRQALAVVELLDQPVEFSVLDPVAVETLHIHVSAKTGCNLPARSPC